MKNKFIITNAKNINLKGFPSSMQTGAFRVYADRLKEVKHADRELFILVDGYALPRSGSGSFDISEEIEVIIARMYCESGVKLVRSLKGIYNILIIDKERCFVFNDRKGIKKSFFYRNGEDIYLTNDLSSLKPLVTLRPDILRLASYGVLGNFLGCQTAFENLDYTHPASIFEFREKIFPVVYWRPEDLLASDIERMGCGEIAEFFKIVLGGYTGYLKYEKIGLTLTGGIDNRIILSAMLSCGIHPEAFTYGNSLSKDVISAENLSKSFNLGFKNYSPEGLNLRFEYQRSLDEVILNGEGLINFHRIYRLLAYKSFNNTYKNDTLIFTGHMGGDLIRNFFYDGLAVPCLVRDWVAGLPGSSQTKSIDSHLIKAFVSRDYLSKATEFIHSNIISFLPAGLTKADAELRLSFNLLASLYHAQDIILAMSYGARVIPFFLDEDINDLLFKTGHSFYHNRNKFCNIMNRYNGLKFCASLIDRLYPPLAEIPLAKKGLFTPREILHSNKLIFMLKTAFNYSRRRRENTPNFVYGEWFKNFLLDNLESAMQNDYLRRIFDIPNMRRELLEVQQNNLEERCWRRFSNIIFLDKVIRSYSN